MSTLTEFEPFVDKTINTMFSRLDDFVEQGRACDIATWLQYCMCVVAQNHTLDLDCSLLNI